MNGGKTLNGRGERVRTIISLLLLMTLGACSGSGEGEEGKSGCSTSQECARGKVCDGGKCKEVACTGHPDCAKNYDDTFCWSELSICSAIECGGAIGDCPAGFECFMFLCLEAEAECVASTQCRQPAEKCYNSSCVPANYCELDKDCPSNLCDYEEHTCVTSGQEDVVEDGGGQVDPVDIQDCDPEDYEDPFSYLCAPCGSDAECGCGQGTCVTIGDGDFCSTPCEEGKDCLGGYACQDEVCKPMGGQCKGCIVPPGCEGAKETCNFKSGECMPESPWCALCNFDYECGVGNRCHMDSAGSIYCAPECDAKTFSCPLGAGCQIRDDGIMICEPTGAECCYGLGCDTCACEAPTPVCTEDGQCVQCLTNGDCFPGKPVCDPETLTCIIQCLPPNPVYWVDPETGTEYCVECAKSLDCPAGMLCGTFKNDPNYHKCYYR